MTIVTLLNGLTTTNNFQCDGEHCTDPNSKVRIIPLDDSCNVCLCASCYQHELTFNEDLELEGKQRILPDLPFCVYPIKLS